MNEYKFYVCTRDYKEVYEITVEAKTDRKALDIISEYAKLNRYLVHQQAEKNSRKLTINMKKVS